MLRGLIIGAALVTVWLPSAAASAEPAAPQPNTPCSAVAKDALTLPAEVPLACDGVQWQAVTDPYPMSDRWLSYGPAMTLHGQGRRNPMLESGDWTATPLSPETTCAATQSAVVSGTPTLTPPQTATGDQGKPLALEVVPRLATIELTGDCLWQRSV
jgi:hypothetical protein